MNFGCGWRGVALFGAIAGMLVAGRAQALDAIGTAVSVEGHVSGSFSGQTLPLLLGDGVVSDEILRSQIASSGQITFVDQTKLFLAPLSTVTLDRFVFDQSGTAKSLTVNVTKGALRLISGRSPHDAYGVKTPLGSLGLRGTIADVVITPGRVYITDQRGPNQGPIVVTARGGGSVVLQPGDSVILTASGITPASAGQVPDFAAACGGCALFGRGQGLGIPFYDPAGHGESPGGKGDSSPGGNQGSSSSSSG
jgi:hypothetical protein